jgi:hypothetical protein
MGFRLAFAVDCCMIQLVSNGVPLPPGGVGYFAGKSFVLMGLAVGCGCKI